ncbi:two-component sensor histidine kinase [Flavipsychrobacter stenotrophus]|uniref:histidine kinase n=1 Tax=Flavipsychrobacter stenotrophus TaxID=2077091 RepID=A0A2S7T1G4_9BACT|nr:HAMP domain-containing sensor histidine kinase [Flavipsychrobacter stenotrophus]PQJ12794.1 two-component sensor histidine kinase [Flavipsychrobacter stenotrophus]
MTIQKKTALIFTSITGTILILVSCVAYFFMNSFAFQDYYKRLEIRGIITAKAELEKQHPHLGEVYSDIIEKHLEPLPGEKEYFFPKDSLDVFLKSRVIPGLPESFYTGILTQRSATLRKESVFYTGLLYNEKGKQYVVIVGAQNEDSIAYARKLKLILVTCVLAGLLVAYTLGIFFSRHTFKPVRDIIEKVKTIGIGNLHLRLEDRRDDDEIAVLASTFNDMLSRLETSFETQNNFVSNASHELRTPLTAIYGEAEIALSRQRNEQEYKQSLEIIVKQAEKLQHLTNSLLNLAQTGFDGKKHNLQQIRIEDLLMDVKDTINNIIPENQIHIDLSELPANEPVVIKGNYHLLKLGLSNVMENACKYSNNDKVSVKATIINKMLLLTILDEGIGIPTDELKYIYDPFFRASNTGKYEGYGIGLPLTRNIFRLHKGEINVHSSAGNGVKVMLSIPLLTA